MNIRRLIERDGITCCWCGKTCSTGGAPDHPDRATIEHVIPRSQGGTNDLHNLKVACFTCNTHRGSGELPTGGHHPRHLPLLNTKSAVNARRRDERKREPR